MSFYALNQGSMYCAEAFSTTIISGRGSGLPLLFRLELQHQRYAFSQLLPLKVYTAQSVHQDLRIRFTVISTVVCNYESGHGTSEWADAGLWYR
jgi:hypothetical protein